MTHISDERLATFTVEKTEVGHLYYFAPSGRAGGPYLTQRHVNAILDIADDGTLAGVELIDDMPPPPQSLRAHGGVRVKNGDGVERSLVEWLRMFRSITHNTGFLWMADDADKYLSSLEASPAPVSEECATDGCSDPATVRFDRGGVGSKYCHSCYLKVQALAAKGGQ